MPDSPIITICSSSAHLPSSQQTKAAAGTSSHRLPTQTAAEALQTLSSENAFVSSGLEALDQALMGYSGGLGRKMMGGFERGKVGEIWGVVGGGKTGIAFQTACEAIRGGGEVVWMDCATLLGASRLKLMDSTYTDTGSGPSVKKSLTSKLHYISLPTLSHLLAQIIHPPPTFPPPQTSLLVIDGLNTLLDLDFPRTGYSSTHHRSEAQKWQSNRRYSILGSLISTLNKLAVLHDLAVIVITGCNSKMRTGEGAAIGPGVGGSEWEAGIHSRIVVFRDFGGRFIGVQKINGRNLMPLDPVSDVSNIIGVEITRDGRLKEKVVDLTSSPAAGNEAVVVRKVVGAERKAVPVRKRVYDEIADSEEDEDIVDEYGWGERDDDEVIVVVDPSVGVEMGKDGIEEGVEEERPAEGVVD